MTREEVSWLMKSMNLLRSVGRYHRDSPWTGAMKEIGLPDLRGWLPGMEDLSEGRELGLREPVSAHVRIELAGAGRETFMLEP